MAQPTNTFDSYDAVGIREDLSDIITNVSPKSLGRQSVMISCNWVNCWKAKFTKVNMPISSEASQEERSTTRGGDLVEPSGSKRPAPRLRVMIQSDLQGNLQQPKGELGSSEPS